MTARQHLEALPFRADRFQVEAADAIDRGESVVVTAPTGAGKTVVAESAISRALSSGRRAVYTTPIKALSNQKFGDFRSSHGDQRVGLLTGDNAINPTADIVVMTTEVLRNMMYAASPDLRDVGVVVLDEVHYLQDRARGGVWEEIIIHLDRDIPLVCLSATIANAEEFAAWVGERRGGTALVVERERPVPLESTYLVRDRWERGKLRLMPVFHGDRANERVIRMLRSGGRGGRRYASPRRHETAVLLQRRGLLPGIFFIFSRKGCDQAVQMVVDRGLRLTSPSEVSEIRSVAEANTRHLSPTDLSVIGYERWLRGLEAGVAPHHAGLVPAMKETVEALFSAGLVRLVFATETLALGINMPARTVVLESLSKFTGEGHELLQPGDYTQLTGRAGRRGIDDEGTAVILHSQYVEFERVAGIAGRGSHPLRSSFRPTYNMAVNLVPHYDRERAEELLGASFAEFADSRQRRQWERDLAADEERLAERRREAETPNADIWELIDRTPTGRDHLLAEFAGRLWAGDVLEWEERGTPVKHAVVARGTGKRPRLLTVNERAEVRRIAPEKLPDSITKVGRVDLPKPFRPRDAAYRKRVAEELESFRPTARETLLTEEATDPRLAPHLEAARAARRLEVEIENRRRRLAGVAPGIVVAFRSITALLETWGYLDGWSLTKKGSMLRGIYNELDLLLAEALTAGWFEDLDGAAAAAFASGFTYEPRREPIDTRWPAELEGPAAALMEAWERLARDERAAGLPATRPPESGFADIAAAWVSGASLADLFGEDDDTAVGDFVRNCRQLIDLLRQIRDIAPELAGVRAALEGLDRGVVAAEGAL